MKKFYSILLIVVAISYNINAQTDVTKKDPKAQINDNEITGPDDYTDLRHNSAGITIFELTGLHLRSEVPDLSQLRAPPASS